MDKDGWQSTAECTDLESRQTREGFAGSNPVPSAIEQFLGIKLPEGVVLGEFKPCFVYHEMMDWLEFVEEDCCTVTEYQRGSNIALLRKWDGEKYCGVVGIKICEFSRTAPPYVVEAFKRWQNQRRDEWEAKLHGAIPEDSAVQGN